MAALCCARTWGDRVGCHERHDRSLDPALSARLQWGAAFHFMTTHHVLDDLQPGDTPLDVIRRAVEALEEREYGNA
jgi:hypothetical protein